MDSKLESMAAVDGRLQSGWQMRHKIPGHVEARHHWPPMPNIWMRLCMAQR